MVTVESQLDDVARHSRRWPESTPEPIHVRRPLSVVASEIEVVERKRAGRLTKRALDIVGASVGMITLAPFMLLVAGVVRLTSKGSALFVQERVGLGGRRFRFYKFRTMVADAEARKSELAHLNQISGPAFKIDADPRVTTIGRLLRKSSLDELPQLWNVLRGDMSLVGPRPPLPDEVECYTKRQARRLAVVPGITGLWQVNGRSALADFDRWVELDLEYVRRWSVGLDLKILLKTAVVVVLARGAQ